MNKEASSKRQVRVVVVVVVSRLWSVEEAGIEERKRNRSRNITLQSVYRCVLLRQEIRTLY